MPPLVSVIIPVHNGAPFLAEALECILNQKYTPLEIIIVDDGSTDDTPRIAAAFGEPIHYYYQPQQGPSAARNREPVLEVLRQALPAEGSVLEIASGTGEHVTFFAKHLPNLRWQPSEFDDQSRRSISAWIVCTARARPSSCKQMN